MANQQQLIPLSDVRVGMYVVCKGLDDADDRCYQMEGLIESEAEIKALMDDGFRMVMVDMARSQVPTVSVPARPAKPKPPPANAAVDMAERVAQVRQVYTETVDLAKQFLQDVRLGRTINVEATSRVVSDMVESILTSGNALQALTRLSVKDSYTYAHSVNVAVLSIFFGQYMGFPRDKLEVVGQAAFLHDLGKSFVPDEILNKPGKLTDEEFTIIKEHPQKGHDMVVGDIGEQAVLCGILQHHERLSGRGYPNGLAAEAIHPVGQLVGIVDVYDALTSKRAYKNAMAPSKALGILYAMRDTDFKAELVDKLVKCLGVYPVGSLVRLSDGTIAIVCEATHDPMLPRVLRCLKADGTRTFQAYLDLTVSRNLQITETLDPHEVGIDPEEILAKGN